MFRTLIKNLNLFGYHGVREEEKINGQNFLFNITIYIKKDSPAGDNIENTVNYSDVIKLVKKINSKERFNLLETLSQKVAAKILNMSQLIEKVNVRIEKTSPPIDENLQSVGVECTLER